MTLKSGADSRWVTEGGDACPVCAERSWPSIDVGVYKLFVCESCRSWSSDARLRGASTSFTPEQYFANDDADLGKWLDLARRLEAREQPVESVLDVGCGTGAFLAHLRARHPEIRQAGIELDVERSALAREKNPDAQIRTGDALAALGEVGEGFDLITLWDVFEHVTAPAQLLRALAGKLSSRGCIFIQTIHEESLVPRLGRLSYRVTGGVLQAPVRRTHEAHHLVFFTKEGLSRAASFANLQIREQWFDSLALERMDGSAFVTRLTAALLQLERRLGNGLFINLILESSSDAPPINPAS
jgi:2-polyprenyl-3-methyl-5-hydroxy-6-metoxy-1,4-benzoquinol methylase